MRAFFSSTLLLAIGAVSVGAACTTSADDPPSSGEGAFLTRSGGTFDKLQLTPTDGTGVIEQARFRAFVSDANNVCSGGARRQGATVLAIDVTGSSAPLTAGSYAGTIDVSKLSASCDTTGTDYASTAATIVIARITTTTVEGTFDASFADGTLTGSFNVPLCPALDTTTCAR